MGASLTRSVRLEAPGELVEKLLRGRPALRILGESGFHQRPQPVWYRGDVRLAVHDPVQDGVGIPGAER